MLQVLDAEAVGDTCLMTAFLGVGIETCGRSHHKGLVVVVEVGEEPLAELVAIIDRQFHNGVESTLGIGAEASGNLVDALDNDVAASNILFAHGIEIVLRGIDSGLAENLTKRGRRKTGLCQTHGDAVNLFVLGDHATDTGTAGAVALGHGVEQHNVLLKAFELHDAEMLLSVVAELAIDLVGKEEEVVLLHYLGNLHQFLFGVEIAGGVVGVANHDGAGARSDGFLKVLDRRQSETGLDVAGDSLDGSVAQFGESVIVGVVGFGNEDFVARVEADGEGKLQGLAAAGGHDNLLGSDMDVVFGIVFDKFLAIGQIASAMAIGQHANLGVGQSLESALGGLDVGLADVEVIDMYSTLLGGVGEGDEFANGRLGQFESFFGDLRHDGIFLITIKKRKTAAVKTSRSTAALKFGFRDALLLCLGGDDVTLDAQHYARIVNSIALHRNGLGETANVVGVVAHVDAASLAGHNGLLGPLGGGAAAGCAHIDKNQRLVASVGELEDIVAVGALLNGTIVVFHLGEGNLRTRNVLLLLLLGRLLRIGGLCIHNTHCRESKEGHKNQFFHSIMY